MIYLQRLAFDEKWLYAYDYLYIIEQVKECLLLNRNELKWVLFKLEKNDYNLRLLSDV